MALGTGHRRHLQAAGGITPWETLANQCSSIDATRLLLAIKDLTDQGCYSVRDRQIFSRVRNCSTFAQFDR